MCLNNKNESANGGQTMAHGGVNSVLRKGASIVCKASKSSTCVQSEGGKGAAGVGSRRIFAPLFKLQVLDSYRNDADCKGNQRATARKYGIHRRQIQKWLQVEHTLRNSVAAKNNNNNNNNNSINNRNNSSNNYNNKVTLASNKSGSVCHNRENANGGFQGTPLDFTTHCRGSPSVASGSSNISARPISSHTNAPLSPLVDPALPIDLSKKSAVGASHFNNNNSNSNNNNSGSADTTTTPATAYLPALEEAERVSPLQPHHHRLAYTPTTGLTSAAPAHHSALSLLHSQYDAASPSSLADTRFDATNICWDLTTKNKRKLDDNNNNNADSGAKKFKLFKPYLNDDNETDTADKPATIVSSTYIPLSLPPPIPIVNQNSPSPISMSSISSSSSSSSPLLLSQPPPQQQQPILCNCSDANCYYGNEADYTYTITELHPSGSKSYYYNNYLYHHHHYNNNNNNNQPLDCYYDDYQQHSNNSALAKQQRQSYSLDFKLSAIDCYYQDSVCKGNQRAVANKYNVHRRQVQKWLKQAEELRLRNESLKQIHTVVR